jgi:hypothetical protein
MHSYQPGIHPVLTRDGAPRQSVLRQLATGRFKSSRLARTFKSSWLWGYELVVDNQPCRKAFPYNPTPAGLTPRRGVQQFADLPMTSGNAILLTRYAERQKALHLHEITYRRQIPSCTMTQINHNRHTDSHPIIRIRMNRDNNRTDNHPMDSHNRHMDNHPMMRHNRTVQHSMVHLHM